MKCLVFDSSTIISLATNNLLRILRPLREKYGGEFYLPLGVKSEIIDKPLTSKKFKFEAMQILSEVADGTLKLEKESLDEAQRIADLANNIFLLHGNYVKVLHSGETSVIVLAKMLGADAIVVDERTTRLMIENPELVAKIMGDKMHSKVTINWENLEKLKEYLGGMTVLRSIELGIMAYDMGLLKDYLKPKAVKIAGIQAKRELLDGLLWGLKLRGCSITTGEIDEIMRLKGF